MRNGISWRSLFVALALCAGIATAACGNGSSGGGGAGGGSAACAPAANVASIVNKAHDPGPPPVMTGGAIADGTYVLTKMVQYNGENGNTPHKETFVFAGGTGQTVSAADGTGPDIPIFFTYATAGNQLTLTFTCGLTGSVTMAYTVAGTDITTVNPDDPNELHTISKL